MLRSLRRWKCSVKVMIAARSSRCTSLERDPSLVSQPRRIQKTRSTLQNRYRLPFYFFCLAILCIVVFALHSIAPHIERGRRNRGHLPDLYDATISDLQTGLSAGHFTSVDLVAVSSCRIKQCCVEDSLRHMRNEPKTSGISTRSSNGHLMPGETPCNSMPKEELAE